MIFGDVRLLLVSFRMGTIGLCGRAHEIVDDQMI
jgi:hypothetical protein